MLVLSQANPPFTRLIDGGALTASSITLTFPLPAIGAGTYFVQVMVDGAISPLTMAGGQPTGPTVGL